MVSKISLKEVTDEAFESMVQTSVCNIELEQCLRHALNLADSARSCLAVLGDNEQGRGQGIKHLSFSDNYDIVTNASSAIGTALAEQTRNHHKLNAICNSVYEEEVLDAVVLEAETREGGR